MKTELKDIMHFYIGCEVEIEIYGKLRNCLLDGINKDYYFLIIPGDKAATSYFKGKYSIKPILRPLSDMTDKEAADIFNMDDWLFINQKKGITHLDFALPPQTFIYLLKQGFDLFGLIESGQAIDATTLKHNN